MEVGLLVFGDLQQPSGGFLYDSYLVAALERAGHRVRLISQPGGMNYATQRRHGRSAPELRAILRDQPPDLLLVDELNHAAVGPVLARYARDSSPDRRAAIVGLVHHLRADESLWAPWTLYAERRFLRSCDAWLCTSTATLNRVVRVAGTPRSSAVAHPGSDGSGYATPLATSAAAPRRSGAGDGGAPQAAQAGPAAQAGSATRPAAGGAPRRILTVSTVIPRKNTHGLIAAVAALRSRLREPVELRIVGDLETDPGYVAVLRRRVARMGLAQQVHFLGRIGAPGLDAEYRAADLFVLPSFHEGFGIVLLEALARGLPVVATARGGAVDIVRPERDGLLVDPRRPTDLVRTLYRLLTDHGLRESCVAGAAARAASFPGWQPSMDGAVRFLEQMARRA